jgi:hypothetical protein
MNDRRSRIDLHVHSTRSGLGGGGLHRFFRVWDSYTTPEEVYRLALARGMDFVTISDHDSVGAAQDLAHYPRFFVSEEVTTQFPEDGTGLHVVALNISEIQHREIQAVRGSVYDLVRFLRSERVVHFVAHPFFPVTTPPTMEHLEKMLLLFNTFEVKNGGKQLVPDDLLRQILVRLTPETIERLADQHDLAPVGQEPWRKAMVGGSDDHAGAFVGHPHTSCPRVNSVADLLAAIAAGECRPEGPGGTALTVAHSVLAVAYRHFRGRRAAPGSLAAQAAWNLLGQLLDNATPDRSLGLAARTVLLVNDVAGRLVTDRTGAGPVGFLTSLAAGAAREDVTLRRLLRHGLDLGPEGDQTLLGVVNRMVNEALADLSDAMTRRRFTHDGSPGPDVAGAVSGLGVLLAPYLGAFRSECRDRPLMRAARRRFVGPDEATPTTVAVFADRASADRTDGDSVYSLLADELNDGARLEWFDLDPVGVPQGAARFTPAASLRAEWWPGGSIALPPVLEVAHALADQDTAMVYLDGVGPMTLLGGALGRLFGIRTVGSPFATGVGAASGPEPESALQDHLHRAYYALLDEVRARSPEEHAALLARGVPPERIMRLGGVGVASAA